MTRARVLIFVLNADHIRLQLEPPTGGIVAADLTAEDAAWLSRELAARITVPNPCPGCECKCHATTIKEENG